MENTNIFKSFWDGIKSFGIVVAKSLGFLVAVSIAIFCWMALLFPDKIRRKKEGGNVVSGRIENPDRDSDKRKADNIRDAVSRLDSDN